MRKKKSHKVRNIIPILQRKFPKHRKVREPSHAEVRKAGFKICCSPIPRFPRFTRDFSQWLVYTLSAPLATDTPLPCTSPTGDQGPNLGMCPNQESNWWPCGTQDHTQATEHTSQGGHRTRKKYILFNTEASALSVSSNTQQICGEYTNEPKYGLIR